MGSFGEFPRNGALRFRRILAGSPETAWEYLTDTSRLAEWFGEGEVSDEIGGKIELNTSAFSIRGSVLERQPHKRLSFSWSVDLKIANAPIVPDSILDFDLSPEGGNTILILMQSPVDSQFRAAAAAGWHALLDILSARIAQVEAPDFMKTFQQVYPEYTKLSLL